LDVHNPQPVDSKAVLNSIAASGTSTSVSCSSLFGSYRSSRSFSRNCSRIAIE
jgi:hypothetical protein